MRFSLSVIKMSATKGLKLLSSELLEFEQKPKIVDGRKIQDWFKVGENVFEYLYNLGTQLSWDFSMLKQEEEAKNVISLVTKNKKWIESFISMYPNFRVDMDLVGSAGDVCRTRSGIEALLRGFQGIDSEFDTVLKNLEDDGDVEEFDRVLKIWIDSGHRPDFSQTDVLSTTPKSHWWWF